ncbi:MAG: hypothetical protein H0W74_05385 [Sphingosinicella sp.]|nr:hypothetical protein [Sphingosinicella sp.]
MRKFLISAALVSAVVISAPAAAQYQNRGGGFGYNQRGGQGVERQIQQLHQRIDAMYQRRLLSDREVQRLHSDAEKISRRHYDYARNGLSQREHQDIMNRLANLRQRLQRERFEGRDQRRDDRRDRW